MGCFPPQDPEIADQKIRNRQLEKLIEKWKKEYKEATKVLLLGMANHELCVGIMINNNKVTFLC